MLLPGQSRPASRKFNQAVAEVQAGLGRRLVFSSLSQQTDVRLRDLRVGGYHDSTDGEERVWLDDALPYTAQEATAAHELAHVIQSREGYPRAYSIMNEQGEPLFPALERLAARATNLVLDESADLWAISRGFDMGKALSAIGLNGLIRDISGRETPAEAIDWESYYASLETLALEIKSGRRPDKSSSIGAEAGTQATALDYAGLSLRLERYGLFGRLDTLWAERWPVSRGMGQEMAAIVTRDGVQSGDACRRTLGEIIAYLRVPSPLLGIK